MRPAVQEKLKCMLHRYQEIGMALSDASVINQNDQFRALSKEYVQLEPIAQCFLRYQKITEDIETAQLLLLDSDPESSAWAEEELNLGRSEAVRLISELHVLLIPKDPDDDHNVFLEIRAGTGGEEAALFVAVLFRMYAKYAEQCHWNITLISEQDSGSGGYKEIIARIEGRSVYARLKFESGVHRVQRIPSTESQGRIHTSTCTVAVLPEVEHIEERNISPAELRIDTYRASGAGGQHVNRTDSAIRITHIPTGIIVECQDERSQHKNRAKAMSLLQSKIVAQEREQQRKTQAATRKSLVGNADRSERIRTYNYPQGRLTDHRIQLTLYQLEQILEGHLTPVIEPLMRELRTEQLEELD